MASQKTQVIEYLFKKNWDDSNQRLNKRLMGLDDVALAIRECNAQYGSDLSDRNPANFMKDFLRGSNASKNWPEYIADKKYTCEQRTSDGECFEFIPYKTSQDEPFPDAFKTRSDAIRYPIQSISLPMVTKSFGRKHETWLIQIAVNLRVIETHFAVDPAYPLFELTHLQMGIKLRNTEIDALFLGKTKDSKSVLITCEAKQEKDPFIQSQIIQQVQAAFNEGDVDTVIPIGLRSISNVGFYLIEFECITRKNLADLQELKLAKDAIYELRPPVQGV